MTTEYTPTLEDVQLLGLMDPEGLRRGLADEERRFAERVSRGVLSGEPEAILLSEVRHQIDRGMSGLDAWRTVLNRPRKAVHVAAEANAQARGQAMGEAKLSAEQAGVVAMAELQRPIKTEGTIPGSTIQKIQPGRQEIYVPQPSRKAWETDEAYYRRIRAQIEQLGQPAGRAKPADSSPDVAIASEDYQSKKRELLASERAAVNEMTHHATAAGSVNLAESTSLRNRALGRMKARGESVDPTSKNFSERYKSSLLEENPK
jgi:hypothetical protein